MPCPALRFEGSPARDCSSGRQCCKEPAEWPAQKTWGRGARATCPLALGGYREVGGGCRGQEPEALRRSPKYQREVVGIRTEGREWGATTAGARDGPATWGPEVRLVLASSSPCSEPFPLFTEVTS